MRLFRPTGLEELRLVFEAQMMAWPPRLPEQPIFYPVCNQGYAAEIASKWNTQETQQVGFVTGFDVEDAFISRFPRKVVGASQHEELWVPAEELIQLNQHLEGPIEVLEVFVGASPQGWSPETGRLKGLDLMAQWEALLALSREELREEVQVSPAIVFLHLPLWAALAPASTREKGLQHLRDVYQTLFPERALPVLTARRV